MVRVDIFFYAQEKCIQSSYLDFFVVVVACS